MGRSQLDSRPEPLDMLAAAETLPAATGNVMALCVNYGIEHAPSQNRHQYGRLQPG